MKNTCCIRSTHLLEGGGAGSEVGVGGGGTYRIFFFFKKTFLLSFPLFVQLQLCNLY